MDVHELGYLIRCIARKLISDLLERLARLEHRLFEASNFVRDRRFTYGVLEDLELPTCDDADLTGGNPF